MTIDTNQVRVGLDKGVPADPGHLIDLARDLCDALDVQDEARRMAVGRMERAEATVEEFRQSLAAEEAETDRLEAAVAACGCNSAAGWAADEKFKAMEAAIKRVRALHEPMPWYEECLSSARHGWCLVKPEDHFYVGEDGIKTCEPNRLPDVCGHCTPEYDGHELRVNWPCLTLVALDDPS